MNAPTSPEAAARAATRQGLVIAAASIVAAIVIALAVVSLIDSNRASGTTSAANAARDAARESVRATAQAEENGTRTCVVADAIRVLIVYGVGVPADPPPDVVAAIDTLRSLEGACAADEPAATTTPP